MDVFFISVIALFPAVAPFLRPGAFLFILVKPQFEAPRDKVEAGGVVRDEGVIRDCIDKVIVAAQSLDWTYRDCIASPICGPKGNQEYVCVFRTSEQ